MATIQYLTRIEFDYGAIKTLPNLLSSIGISKPLLVTDPFLSKTAIVGDIQELLSQFNPILFAKTPQNPTEDAVEEAVQVYLAEKCDGIIAIGGGSSIDLAKGVALLATHPGPIEQYAVILGGLEKISSKVVPVIAVPTTAGTGSEVGRAALISLRDGRKLGFISPHLIPKIALCDPELTLGLPPSLTAATGMDALTHCIETYLSPRVNPPADAIAIDGAKRAATWIELAFNEGSNRDARWNMMMASLQGGLTFQKGLGAVHSMSHPLGGIKSPVLHHGTLNAVILPAVLRFNELYCTEKFAELKIAMGVPNGTSLDRFIENLNQKLNLPKSLSAMGVTRGIIPAMVEGALKDHSSASNPRPLSKKDFELLFEEALN
ncbi:EutG Alcohol dehydrogenase, class IV [Burkholderiaceae bacterium]|jgi:alcohol dehydrogenase class IV